MKAARVRIGRVTMKAGGADLRVLHPPNPSTPVRRMINGWAASSAKEVPPPDAFFAISFRLDPDRPGSVKTHTSWESDHVAFPVSLLPDMAINAVRTEMIVSATKQDVMEELGYVPIDPDPAS